MTSFPEFVSEIRPPVDAALDRLLPGEEEEPARLHAAMRYSVFAGGKRVRPALVILAGEMYEAPRPVLLPGAAAIEMIHTFSLVHDDLPALDDDDLRRGRPTVHRHFDEALAVLAGDALLNHALWCLSREPRQVLPEVRARALELTTEAVGSKGMIGGQVADLEAEREWPAEAEEVLTEIHRRKTGSLLGASLRLGGLYAGAGAEADRLLCRLGEAVGLLFQIGDDLLDVEASTEQLGKTAGKDAARRKLTYPELLGVEESRRRLDLMVTESLDLVESFPGAKETLRSLVRYLGERDR